MLRISPRNSKVPFPNISHTPIKGCGNCGECAGDCYAMRPYRQYPNTKAAWDSNLELWEADPDRYIADLMAFLGKTRKRMFRFFVAGDVPDQRYIDQVMSAAACKYPHIRFLVFTKMHHLDYSERPDNLQVVFSQWPGMPMPTRTDGIQLAWMQDGTEKRIPKDALWCPGNCGNCGMCWELNKLGKDVWFDKH